MTSSESGTAAAESSPRPLEDGFPAVRETLADAEQLLVCLDFDGTLAPIVDDPDAARPTEDNRHAVARLAAHPDVTTAVVSGRALRDVRGRIDGPAIYAGNHGLELERRGSIAVHPVARKRAARIDRLCTVLETTLASIPNVRIENKRLSGTVHFRSVPPAARPVARRLTTAVFETFSDGALELSRGKRILEIGPSIPWGKGNAVELIAADEPPGTAAVYVGDDVTDESAFRAVEPDGIGVQVGGDGPSAASRRVESPAGVASLLTRLADGMSSGPDRRP